MSMAWIALAANPLGWTLLHSCWQGALVAVVLWCVLRLVHARASRLRYGLACGALVLMVAFPVATFGHQLNEARALHAIPVVATLELSVTADAGGLAADVPWTERAASLLDRTAPWLPVAWLGGMALFLVRLNLGLIFARRVRAEGTAAAPPALNAIFREVARRLGVQRVVGLLHSARVQVPTVIGWMKPVVLIPISCLAGLSEMQIEALLAHELAHIQRHDYLVSVMQSVVEAVLFYQPAVWWISKQVRRERECCCDDLAVQVGGDALGYAKALELLEVRRSCMPEVALGANGGVLTMRVRRLLGYRESSAGSQVAAALVLTIMVGSGGVMLANTARAQAGVDSGSVEQSVPAAPGVDAVPDPNPRRLSDPQRVRQQRDLVSDRNGGMYHNWLVEDVVWIITSAERETFRHLSNDDERDLFITQFWERRNPAPGSATNSFRDEHYARIAYANQRFGATETPGWKSDRGHIYIAYGKPESIDSHPSGDPSLGMPPFEVWHYESLPGSAAGTDLKFVDDCHCGKYELKTSLPGMALAPSTVAEKARVVPAAYQGVGTSSQGGAGGVQGIRAIEGVVIDPTGAVVANATVTATNAETGVKTSVRTDSRGQFAFTSLPDGRYDVIVDVPGFKRLLMSVVKGAQATGLTLRLQVGSVEVRVDVGDGPVGPGSVTGAPRPTGPVRMSGGVMARQLVSRVDPVYPPDAKAARVQGAVVLHALISKTGAIENLTVVSGPEALRSSAVDAVKRWTYKPYLLNGEPTEVDTTITVNYSFGGEGAYSAPGQGAGAVAPSEARGGRPQRVSSGVMAGALISRVDPVYPAEAKTAGVQGAVVLRAVIAKTGLVENLTVVSGPTELVASAIDAVRQWVYKPYLLNGEPTEVETTVTVNYSFGGGAGAVAPLGGTGSAAAAGEEAPRRIGGGVSTPVLVSSVEPEYTPEARAEKASGTVLVTLVVDIEGNPTKVRVLRGIGVGRAGKMDPAVSKASADALNGKAVEAVKQYKFKPAVEAGKPVPVELNIEVNFQVF